MSGDGGSDAGEERFARIFDAISTMLAFTEPAQGRILAVNAAWLRATGLARADVIGRTGSELRLWRDERVRDEIRAELARAGRVREREAELRMGAATIPASISAERITMQGVDYILWEIRDLSERRRADAERAALQEQLFRARKMESIGRLAGGIAHDFNNLLTVINGSSGLVLQGLARDDERYEPLADIQTAGEHAAALTRQLLSFTHRQAAAPRAVDLNAIVAETVHLLRRVIGEEIELVATLEPALGRVLGDPEQLGQVVMNLALNARDAMPAGGRLTIATSRAAPPAARVRLAVTDTGVGIDAATRQRLFEPFFTTKPRGQGTGLGLYVVWGIVEQAGGRIDVDSVVGAGSTFRIELPLAAADAPAAAGRPALAAAPRGSETLLVVEDQPQVRRLAVRVLERLGYVVHEASGASEATRLFERHGAAIDLLLTDVILPGLSGPALAESLRRQRPGLKVLFMSGYSEQEVHRHGVASEAPALLQKPFTPSELARRLRERLDAPLP